MNKKGFTLIELLAVIVILAIIALIATPAVLNIIEDSRRSAAEASTRNIANAAKTYYATKLIGNSSINQIDITDGTLKYSGEQATKGKVYFDNEGNTYLKLYINGYCVERNYNGVVSSGKVEESECEIPEAAPESDIEKKIGDVVYYNPTLNDYCTDYAEANSELNNLSGCMKWYIYSVEENGYKLLLDHGIDAESYQAAAPTDEETGDLYSISEKFNYYLTNKKGWVTNGFTPETLDFIKLTKFYENLENKEDAVYQYMTAAGKMYDELKAEGYDYLYADSYGFRIEATSIEQINNLKNKIEESYSELMVPKFIYGVVDNACSNNDTCLVGNFFNNDTEVTAISEICSVYSIGTILPIGLFPGDGQVLYLVPAIQVAK